MDLTFQAEYNEQRSARVIGRAWAVRTKGATILSWCMGIAGLIWLFGYFEHIKELHKSTVFLESEKEKWLEKVRPIAKDLYVPDDEEDGEASAENVLTSAVDAKTTEERTAAVVKSMKQLKVKAFEAKAGEEIAQVVTRLHELAKPGLPGLPPERSGISILLKSRPQEREQAEKLRKGFRVEDVSFYDVAGAFCVAANSISVSFAIR